MNSRILQRKGALTLVQAIVLLALLGAALLVVSAPRADAAEGDITGSSVLATWNCTSSPCPWGTQTSGQAAVWPAAAGPSRARYGYTVTHDVYADAAKVAGWKITVDTGSAAVYAGTPNDSHSSQASLSAGQSYTIPALSAGVVVSLQSDSSFQYTLTPGTTPPPTPTPTTTPTGTASVLATWNCTSSPCPWGTQTSGQAAVWPAAAGPSRARYGYTVTHDVYADAAKVAGWKITVDTGNATVYAGTVNDSHSSQASLSAGQSYTIETFSAGLLVSLQSGSSFQYTLTPGTAPTPTPTPTTTTPTPTPTTTPTTPGTASVLATWNCTSSPCPWGATDSSQAAVWPAAAGPSRARYGYTVTHDIYAAGAKLFGWKVTVNSGSAFVFGGPADGSQSSLASLTAGQSFTFPQYSNTWVISLQGGNAFQYTVEAAPATASPCTNPTTCDPVSWIPSRWRYNGTDPSASTATDWIGGVIAWPSWSAYSTNIRSGLSSRTVYSESGEVLYPYMGSWANGCKLKAVSGTVLVVEWERGQDTWREKLLSPGDTYTINLTGSENNAMIENPSNFVPFSVSLSNCTPRQIKGSDPVAAAGPAQTAIVGSTVTLDGSGSRDVDGDALTYAWTQTGGPAVTLSSATAAKPTFTAPSTATSLTFSLTVNDGKTNSTASTTTVTVIPPPNLAQGKTATQSSTLTGTGTGGPAARAVDGNTNGIWANGSVTQTTLSVQPWWQLDLGAAASVSAVTLWNRTDCCADRLANGTVFISPTDMTGKTYTQLRADPSVKSLAFGSLTGPSLSLAAGDVAGRYVRVQLSGINYLHLAEVQVTGQTGAVNLSTARSATQSTTNAGAAAARAVDGRTDGVLANGSVSQTAAQSQPWWQVDLGASSRLTSITVWNRTDCCADRLNNAVVFLSATDMTSRTYAQLQADASVTKLNLGATPGVSTTLSPNGAVARFVRVQSPATSSAVISLAEVQVVGTQPAA